MTVGIPGVYEWITKTVGGCIPQDGVRWIREVLVELVVSSAPGENVLYRKDCVTDSVVAQEQEQSEHKMKAIDPSKRCLSCNFLAVRFRVAIQADISFHNLLPSSAMDAAIHASGPALLLYLPPPVAFCVPTGIKGAVRQRCPLLQRSPEPLSGPIRVQNGCLPGSKSHMY
jgi:hypothetical protein